MHNQFNADHRKSILAKVFEKTKDPDTRKFDMGAWIRAHGRGEVPEATDETTDTNAVMNDLLRKVHNPKTDNGEGEDTGEQDTPPGDMNAWIRRVHQGRRSKYTIGEKKND